MAHQKVAEYDLYKRIKLLGQGSYGKAYLVESVADKQLCVIKQMDMNNMSEDERKETIKEARILEALKHPNIVKFREVYKTQKGKLCIVMEYAEGGDLAQKIKEYKGQFMRENLILDWFTQMALAIKHCHDRKIIHRDLKTQNIFINKDQTILLGDFGIAKVLNHTRQKCKTMVGTPYYLSPEIINSQMYSFKTDIWSLGIVLYEMCALQPPFDAPSIHHLAMKIVQGKYQPIPSLYSKDLKILIAQLLQIDPNKRPNIHEVLKTPLIQNRIKKFLSETIRQNEFSHTIIHKQNFVSDSEQVNYPSKPVTERTKEEQAPMHHYISQQQLPKQQQQQPIFNNLFTPQSQKPNHFFQQQQQQQRLPSKQLMHNPSTPQLQNNYQKNPIISKLEQQQNKFVDNNRVFQPISNQPQQQPSKYLPSRYQDPYQMQKKPLHQQIEEKKQELKKMEEFKYERCQKNEQLFNKIADHLKDDNYNKRQQQRDEERRKMKKDIQEKRKQNSIRQKDREELQVDIRVKHQNYSKHSNNSIHNDSRENGNNSKEVINNEFQQQSPLTPQISQGMHLNRAGSQHESDPKSANKFLKKSEPKSVLQKESNNVFQFSDEKEDKYQPKNLQRQQSEIIQPIVTVDKERKVSDISYIPNNEEYLKQVYGDLENIQPLENNQKDENSFIVIPEEISYSAEQDKENENSSNQIEIGSEKKKGVDQTLIDKSNEIQEDLDKSVAQVMKKYEQNDSDREDDDEDLYQENEQDQEETQKMSLLKVLQAELGCENAHEMISEVKSKIKSSSLEQFAIKGFYELKDSFEEENKILYDKYIGMIVMYAIMNE